MGLSGLQIYKLLPRTNCKECGFPTCLAFAMKLAARQVELSACPYVSDESKSQLDAASAPPIRLVSVGPEKRKVEVGNETVLYRHEKTFYHEPGLFYRIKDDLAEDEFAARVAEIADYVVERVGIELSANGVALECASGDAGTFAQRAEAVVEAGLPVILLCDDPAAVDAALKAVGSTKPLIYGASDDTWEAMAGLAKQYEAPLAVSTSDGLDGLAALTAKIKGAGVEDLVLDPGVRAWPQVLKTQTTLRRLALKKNFRDLGYPTIVFPGEAAEDPVDEALMAAQAVAKYAGFIVLDTFDPASLYPLLTLRQNIYTDPQKPIQVSPGLYEIGDPGPDAPLLVTTNFSLTYFSVAGEVEGLGRPAWLMICDSEGMSVLTAWAAGKFDAERIGKSVKEFDVASKLNHRKIVIPGHVSSISGELEEELPDWEILVGPREAIGIPSYLRNWS